MLKIVLKKLSFQIVIILAFYIAGFASLFFENHSHDHSIFTSTAIFTGIFCLIIGSTVKTYLFFK